MIVGEFDGESDIMGGPGVMVRVIVGGCDVRTGRE